MMTAEERRRPGKRLIQNRPLFNARKAKREAEDLTDDNLREALASWRRQIEDSDDPVDL